MYKVLKTLISRGTTYYSGPISDHFDGVRFYNPGKPHPHTLWDILKWRLTTDPRPWPQSVNNEFEDNPPSSVRGEQLRVSWVGHVTFLLQTHGVNILTDPVWSDRASPVDWAGPKRVHAPGIKMENLPPIDLILISHNHYDHLDVKTLQSLWNRDKPRIIVPLGNDQIIKDFDSNIQVEAYDWKTTIKINEDIKIGVEPMHHWSARGLFDWNKALWAAFVIKTPSGNIYFVGDSGYGNGDNFKEVLHQYESFRLALLPIGAFSPRWLVAYSHMSPLEAIAAFKDLNTPRSIPIHYATFPLADDGYDEALKLFMEHLKVYEIESTLFKPLKIGEYCFIPEMK